MVMKRNGRGASEPLAILASIALTLAGVFLLRWTDAPRFGTWFFTGFFGLGAIALTASWIRTAVTSRRGTELVLSNAVNHRKGTRIMGADAFVAFYGIKIPLDPDDEETLDACGAGTDPRCVAATRVGLQHHSGRMTDGDDYFLYLGIRLGWLGLELEQYTSVPNQRLTETMATVQTRLKQAGFSQQPSLHLQFEGQY